MDGEFTMSTNMKRVYESRSTLSELMLPNRANPDGKVHGGEVMKMMDSCAGVTAARHAKMNAVTVRVDEMVFHLPVLVAQLVICESHVVFVGKTSMEIKVTLKVEDLKCEAPPKVALTAFFTFVALDQMGKPTQVPGIILSTDEEKQAYEDGRKRYLEYKKKKTSV